MISDISVTTRNDGCTDDDSSDISVAQKSRSHRGRPKMSRMSLVVLPDEIETGMASFFFPRLHDLDELLDDIRHRDEVLRDTSNVSENVFCLKKDTSEVQRVFEHAKLSFEVVNQVCKSLDEKKEERIRAIARNFKFDLGKMDCRWSGFEEKQTNLDIESKEKQQVF